MRLDHLRLEQRDVLDLDARVLEQADAGIEAVHHRRFVMHPVGFDEVAAFLQRGARAVCERHLEIGVARSTDHLFSSQGKTVYGKTCHLCSACQVSQRF
ncbi:hypothetical protein D9M68_945410 [compost metagenome]